MYAAQITATLEVEIPKFWELVEQGNLIPIKEWLTDKVYQYGKLRTPSELIKAITGKPLDPDYLVAYLREEVYRTYTSFK